MPDNCVFDNSRQCLGEKAVIKLEARVKYLEEWQKGSREFHENFYEWQRSQIARDAKLDEQIKTISNNLEKLVKWQEEEKNKPAKRLDGYTEKIVYIFISAVIGFVLASIGIKG